ncbi:MAG: VanW family protein [Candidatus Buchananbacteria bacterium]
MDKIISNNFSDLKNKNKKPKWWLLVAAVFLILVFILTGSGFAWENAYAQKFYPGIKIGNFDVSGKTKDEVWQKLKSVEQNLTNTNLSFTAEKIAIKIEPVPTDGGDPDLVQPILVFNWQTSLDSAYQVGRTGNWFNQIKEQLTTLINKKTIPINYELNDVGLVMALQNSFSQLEKPPVNAALKIENDQPEIIGEESGYIFNYQKAIDQLRQNINNLDFKTIDLDLVFSEPTIKKADVAEALPQLNNILAIETVKLTAEGQNWELKKPIFISWLEFQKIDGKIVIGFNQQKVNEFLDPIAKTINIEAKEAKLQMTDGKITEFQATQDGITLNLEQSYKKLNDQITTGTLADTELVVDITKAKVVDTDVQNLGVQELLGKGTSNFSGSPKNRRINIAVGAKTLNGLLIAPGEEFSMIKALGAIDGEHGYKQELVIKGNKTLPEYGGGLCQIGTTAFRAALRSGLPITERRNHSYRVVYYEPAGMDATIYDPKPDLKFLNDTQNYILFMTKISGDELIFEFYGTKDGRQIKIEPDPPRIFNITNPPAAKYIETDTLKPGEKKRTETPHKGADTYFKYTITYPNGEIKEQEFKSHYVAWPEIWLVGVASTTPATTETMPQTENQTTPTAPAADSSANQTLPN